MDGVGLVELDCWISDDFCFLFCFVFAVEWWCGMYLYVLFYCNVLFVCLFVCLVVFLALLCSCYSGLVICIGRTNIKHTDKTKTKRHQAQLKTHKHTNTQTYTQRVTQQTANIKRFVYCSVWQLWARKGMCRRVKVALVHWLEQQWANHLVQGHTTMTSTAAHTWLFKLNASCAQFIASMS